MSDRDSQSTPTEGTPHAPSPDSAPSGAVQCEAVGMPAVRNGRSGATPAAMAEIAERVRRAAAHSTTPAVLLDLHHRIAWVNDVFARLLGVTDAVELVGLPFEPVVGPPAAAAVVVVPNRPALHAGRMQTHYTRNDGSVVAVDQRVSTLCDTNGSAAFLLVIAELQDPNEAKAIRFVSMMRRGQQAAASAEAYVDAGARDSTGSADATAAMVRANREAEIERIRRAMLA